MKLNGITRAVGKATLKVQKTSPNLLFAAGIVGVIGGAVLASRATLKVESVVDKSLSQLEDINAVVHSEHPSYSTEDMYRDKGIVYVDLAVELTKLYGPAIIVGGLGIACLTGSHRILTKRNAALTVAYAALERTYNAYRANVQGEIGPDREAEIHYNTVKELALEDKLAKQAHKKPPKIDYSQYAKFFDEANPNWTRSAEKNLAFLQVQQKVANDILHSRGYILLNDVYDMLGIPRSTAGCVVGWTMYDDGDNYVDFGIFNHWTDEVRSFVNGVEKSVLLDFNVDGVVYEKIER